RGARPRAGRGGVGQCAALPMKSASSPTQNTAAAITSTTAMIAAPVRVPTTYQRLGAQTMPATAAASPRSTATGTIAWAVSRPSNGTAPNAATPSRSATGIENAAPIQNFAAVERTRTPCSAPGGGAPNG